MSYGSIPPLFPVNALNDGVGAAENDEYWQQWRKVILYFAWASVFWNVLEGLAGVGLGYMDTQLALMAFGLQSSIEVGSAAMVLWRFKKETTPESRSLVDRDVDLEKERIGSRVIGILLVALGTMVSSTAILHLYFHHPPGTARPALIVACISWAAMGIMYLVKIRGAIILNSRTTEADANCSLACMKLSTIVIIGTSLRILQPQINAFCTCPSVCDLWWVDSVASLVLAVLIARDGVRVVQHTYSAEFSGGCACCVSEEPSRIPPVLSADPELPTADMCQRFEKEINLMSEQELRSVVGKAGSADRHVISAILEARHVWPAEEEDACCSSKKGG